MELDDVMKHLQKTDEIHLEERARLLIEIGGFGVGGIELPSISERAGEITREVAVQHALEESMRNLWSDAFVCYVERRFRACVILLGCLVEATLSLELEKRRVKKPSASFLDRLFRLHREALGIERFTLGRLIEYCYGNKVISREVYGAAKEINALRNMAVHLKMEREKPLKSIETTPDIDEEVPLKDFKNPPVTISEGWISGDGVTFVWRPGFTGILYRYKKAADRAFKNARFILRSLYNIKFKIEN